MSGKRLNYISWDTYFMLVAIATRERSKDPRTQVGAVIVKNNHLLSVGYNGTPKGMSDDEMPWDSQGEKNKDLLQIKNTYVVHAEANAMEQAHQILDGATLYVTLFPCMECAKRIAQCGIKEVVYLEEYKHLDQVKASQSIFKYAEVSYRKFIEFDEVKKTLNKIHDNLPERKLTKIKYIRKDV